MQSNKINSYINKKLKEISRNNQFRKLMMFSENLKIKLLSMVKMQFPFLVMIIWV